MNARVDSATNILTAIQNRSLRVGFAPALDTINHVAARTTTARMTPTRPGELMSWTARGSDDATWVLNGGSDGTRTRGLRRDRP
jgi:hypothetical protein